MRCLTGSWYERVQRVFHAPHMRAQPEHIEDVLLCTLVLEAYFVHHAAHDWSYEKQEAVLASVCLVQCGLRAHEAIDAIEHGRGRRVLIGDYLSAQYYFLLASLGCIEEISVIAQAICVYTEAKQAALATPLAQRRIAGERAVFVAWERRIDAQVFGRYAQTIDAVIATAARCDDADVRQLYAQCSCFGADGLSRDIDGVLQRWAVRDTL